MKSFFAISSIFLLLVNICSISLLKLTYESNKSYFTNNFCVNKAKPKLKCEGKCHMNKTLKKVESAKGIEKGIQNLNLSFEFTSEIIEIRFVNVLYPEKTEINFAFYFNTSDHYFLINKPPIVA